MYENAWKNFRSEFPTPKQGNKFLSIYLSKQIRGTAPQKFPHLSLLDIYVLVYLKILVYSSQTKNKETSQTHFLCLPNHSQPPRDLQTGAPLHGRLCPCVYWLRWRKFWASVVKCDLINNNNSTAIKFGTCIVNVIC